VSPTQVVDYVNQIADALDYVHSKNLVHRDIKPANLLVGKKPNGEEKVLVGDFGLAQVFQNTTSRRTQDDRGGTFAYMAPEQMLGRPCKESDQYALGVVVYQWLSGNLPFRGTVYEIMAQHIMSPPEPIPGISQQIQDVVFRALAKKPDERFENVTAFAQAFERACRGSSPSERREEASASRSRCNRDQERPEFASEQQELQKEVKAHCESGEQHRRAGRYEEALAEFN
jgi:serine/threonine protein kinase